MDRDSIERGAELSKNLAAELIQRDPDVNVVLTSVALALGMICGLRFRPDGLEHGLDALFTAAKGAAKISQEAFLRSQVDECSNKH